MSVGVLVSAFLLVFATGTFASPQSRDLVSRGAVDLTHDKVEPALAAFVEASKVDPTDSEAVYFQAVALNRLGRHSEALDALERATKLGYQHKDVALERGWALVGTRRWAEAIGSLNMFEASDPGRGQTSLLLGQAYRGLGEPGKALAAFDEAVRRDPSLAAQANQLKNDVKAGKTLVSRDSIGVSTQSPRAGSLRSQGYAGDTVVSTSASGAATWDRRTRGAVGMGGGNNSNVISLGDTLLAGEITSANDSFLQMWADLSADWQFNAKDGLTLGYFGTVTNYDTIQTFDLTDHILYATYRRQLDTRWLATLSVADDYTELGGLAFRNVFSVRPAVNYLLDDGDTLELALFYSHNNFFFPDITPFFDRDGDTTSVSATHYFHIKDTRLTGRVGYYHLWNSTRGSDFDFESDGAIFGLAHPIGNKGANIFGFYSHTWDDYDNLNSLAGFAFARSDESDRFTLQVSAPIQKQISVYGRYERTEFDSNVGAFTFDQEIVSGGFVAGF